MCRHLVNCLYSFRQHSHGSPNSFRPNRQKYIFPVLFYLNEFLYFLCSKQIFARKGSLWHQVPQKHLGQSPQLPGVCPPQQQESINQEYFFRRPAELFRQTQCVIPIVALLLQPNQQAGHAIPPHWLQQLRVNKVSFIEFPVCSIVYLFLPPSDLLLKLLG